MKRQTLPSLFAATSWFIASSSLSAPQPAARPTGVFSDMHWVEEAGDVFGTEIFILYSTDGYWALVQIAGGAPGPPVLVKAMVKEGRIEFTLPDDMGGRFVGRVSRKGLVGKFERFTEETKLSRRKSYWQ